MSVIILNEELIIHGDAVYKRRVTLKYGKEWFIDKSIGKYKLITDNKEIKKLDAMWRRVFIRQLKSDGYNVQTKKKKQIKKKLRTKTGTAAQLLGIEY